MNCRYFGPILIGRRDGHDIQSQQLGIELENAKKFRFIKCFVGGICLKLKENGARGLGTMLLDVLPTGA